MKFYKLFFLFFLTLNLNAQKFDWKGRFGGVDSDTAVCLDIDDSGNLYNTGIFYGQIDLNQDTTKSSNFISKGLSDFYIQKTNPFGEFIWGKQFGGDSIDRITDLKLFNNNLYVIGQFSKKIIFDNIELNSSGSLDVFVAQLDTSGMVVWAKSFGGVGNDIANSIEVNSTGVYVVGLLKTSGFDLSCSNSSFIAKLNLQGTSLEWSKKIGFDGNVKFNSISLDSKDDLFIVGSFAGEKIDFNPSIEKDSLLSSEKKPNTTFYTQDAVLLKLSNSGDFIFVNKIGGSTGDEIIYGSDCKKGKLVLTGQFSGSVVFGGPSGKTLVSNGKDDAFVASYDQTGILQWVKNAGGLKTDWGRSIFLDSNLNVYSTGTFFDTDGKGVDFDPSSKIVKLYSSSSQNAYVWKLDVNGEYVYAVSFGGTGVDNGVCVIANSNEEIFATGIFEGKASFYDSEITSNGKSDVYLLKSVKSDLGFIIEYAIDGVDPKTVPFRLEVNRKDIGNLPWYNNQFVLVSAKYSDGDTNSVLILKTQGFGINYAAKACADLTIGEKDDWFLPSFEELKLIFNNRNIIGGLKLYPYWSSTENNQNSAYSIDFTDGTIASNSNKADRKYVRPVRKKMKNDGLNSENIINIDVNPNPVSSVCKVSVEQKYVQNGINIELLNASGQILSIQFQNVGNFNIDLSDLVSGMYFIRISNNTFQTVSKIVKE